MLCVLPSLTLPTSDSKSTKICFDPIQTLSITFFFFFPHILHFQLHLEAHRPCTGDPGKGGEYLHQALEALTRRNARSVWRWMGCGHTHLLPVAVCGEGPVGSPPQRCPVVVEVASRVHLVLHAQNNTHWLESSLDPLKTILHSAVANHEQSLHLQNPDACRTPCTKDAMRGLQPTAAYTFDISTDSLLSFYVKNKHCTFYVCQILEFSIQNTALALHSRYRLRALYAALCPWPNKTCISRSTVMCI